MRVSKDTARRLGVKDLPARRRVPAPPSHLVADLKLQIRALGLPPVGEEYRFDEKRNWRFDLCWLLYKVAVECEGGTQSGGRHTRGAGFEKDCEKYNAAALAGWTLLRFTLKMIRDGRAIATIEQAMKDKGWRP